MLYPSAPLGTSPLGISASLTSTRLSAAQYGAPLGASSRLSVRRLSTAKPGQIYKPLDSHDRPEPLNQAAKRTAVKYEIVLSQQKHDFFKRFHSAIMTNTYRAIRSTFHRHISADTSPGERQEFERKESKVRRDCFSESNE